MAKILIIEDELHIAEGIELNLSIAGHETTIKNSGGSGLAAISQINPDLVILDIMLPDMDGFKILDKIRTKNISTPVLILSARGDVEDRKLGLSKGCDDYMPKPFDLEELELRVQRLLARTMNEEIYDSLKFGENIINFQKRTAFTKSENIHLTEQESKILQYLSSKKNTPVSREELLKNALGYKEKIQSRTIDNFMVRFRKYFEKNPKNPTFFKSIRSVGYMFSPFTDKDRNK